MNGYLKIFALIVVLFAVSVDARRIETYSARINVEIPPAIEAPSDAGILIERFYILEATDRGRDISKNITLDEDAKRLFSSEFRKRSEFNILDGREKIDFNLNKWEEIIADGDFWKKRAEAEDAEIIITGTIKIQAVDRSAYETKEIQSPFGGVYRTHTLVDKTGFVAEMECVFIAGADGAILHRENIRSEKIYNGKTSDFTRAFYDLVSPHMWNIAGVFAKRTIEEERTLLIDL